MRDYFDNLDNLTLNRLVQLGTYLDSYDEIKWTMDRAKVGVKKTALGVFWALQTLTTRIPTDIEQQKAMFKAWRSYQHKKKVKKLMINHLTNCRSMPKRYFKKWKSCMSGERSIYWMQKYKNLKVKLKSYVNVVNSIKIKIFFLFFFDSMK